MAASNNLLSITRVNMLRPFISPYSKLVVVTIFLLLAQLVSGQDATVSQACTGCSNHLNLQVVVTGVPIYSIQPDKPVDITWSDDAFPWTVATAAPVKITQSCAIASLIESNGRFLYTGCEDWGVVKPSKTLALDADGLVLSSVSILETIIIDYTLFQATVFGSECITLAKVVNFTTPITIGASNAHLTIDTGILTYGASYGSARTTITTATSVVLGSDVLKSLDTTCRVPTTLLKPVSVTPIGSQPASTLVLQTDSNTGLPQSSRVIIGLIAVAGLLTWIGFLIFFIWWRRAVKRASDQNQGLPQSQSKGLSPTRIRGFRSQALKIPGIKASETRKPTKSTRPRKSWKAPLTMLAGLICGSCFAIGHHFLYENIHGLPVDYVQTSQVWFLRSGNLLASLVRLSYAISIGVAFVQVQWLKLHQFSLRVKDIDAISNALADILNMIGNSVWLRLPSLTLLALIFWSIALVPIFTPGTLDVQTLTFQNITYVQVPQLDYSNMTQWTYAYNGYHTNSASGSVAVKQIALATAVGGQILSLSPYMPNGTYTLDFHGPAVQCHNASRTVQQEFLTYYATEYPMLKVPYRYLSRVDFLFAQEDNNVDFLDVRNGDYSRIWIMTPELPLELENPQNQSFLVTECGLFNAKYRMQFSYQNAQQKVDVLSTEYLDGVSWNGYIDMSMEGYLDVSLNGSTPIEVPTFKDKMNQVGSYCGLMAEFGSILVGNLHFLPEGMLVTSNTKVELLDFDYIGIASQELQAKLEELFQNMTISLLSRQEFRKDPTQADWIRVEDHVQLVSYVYDSIVLVITYGLAFILTQMCVLLGLYAVSKNRGSYQNRFSTFLRATKNASELREYSNKDDNAADPRPKALSRATVELFRSQQSETTELRTYPTQDGAHKSLLTEVVASDPALRSPSI